MGIYSEVGQGTIVWIYLPRHLVDEAAEAVPEREWIVRSDVDSVVLVIGDEPLVRMLVTDVVEDLGYTAGRQGPKVLRKNGRIDLLVTTSDCPTA